MNDIERRILSWACIFTLMTSLVTVVLVALDVRGTPVPIPASLVGLVAIYVTLTSRASRRPPRRYIQEALEQFRAQQP
jgi:hypothetical protein